MSSSILLILIYHGCIGDALRINQGLLVQPPRVIPTSRFAALARAAIVSASTAQLAQQPARAPAMEQSTQFADKIVKDGDRRFLSRHYHASRPALAQAGMEITDQDQVGNKFDFNIIGHDLQLVEVTLKPGEKLVAESGSVCFFESDITFDAQFNDGSRPSGSWWANIKDAGQRVLAGASISILHVENSGQEPRKVAFSSPIPGHTVGIDLGAMGGSIMCSQRAFLCAARGTSIQAGVPQKLSTQLFGGEGFFLQKLEGDGLAFIHACGAVIRRDLKEGEQLRVNTGCVVGFSSTVKFDIARVGSIKTSLFGGQGIFFGELTGPGVVWIQSVPFNKVAMKLHGEMPRPEPARPEPARPEPTQSSRSTNS